MAKLNLPFFNRLFQVKLLNLRLNLASFSTKPYYPYYHEANMFESQCKLHEFIINDIRFTISFFCVYKTLTTCHLFDQILQYIGVYR